MDRLNQVLGTYKIPIALSLVGAVLVIGGIFSSGLNSTPKELKVEDFPQKSIVKLTSLKVDVSGAVNKPGVFEFEADSRVEDAIAKAEGFSEDANTIFISKYLNLSKKISDGEKIYIPFEDEKAESFISSLEDKKINLNKSTQSELEDLPGIGEVTASKIVATRPFNSVEELLTKKIINKTVYDKVKDLVEAN